MTIQEQITRMDTLLAELYEEAWRSRPQVGRLRTLAEDLAWEFEPLRARLLGEEPMPDLRALSRPSSVTPMRPKIKRRYSGD